MLTINKRGITTPDVHDVVKDMTAAIVPFIAGTVWLMLSIFI